MAVAATALAAGESARADSGAGARALFGVEPAAPTAPPPCAELGDFGCVFPDDPMAEFAPGAITSTLTGAWLRALPTQGATHDQVASYALGTAPDPRGITVPGASAIEHRWLIDGAPADDIRAGTAGGRILLDMIDTITVTTGGFSARDRASTGAIIDAHLRTFTTPVASVSAWIQTTAPERAVRPARYLPVTLSRGVPAAINLAMTQGAPISLPHVGQAWWIGTAALHVGLTEVTREGRRLVDRNSDGAFDRDASGLVTESIARASRGRWDFDAPAALQAGVRHGPHTLTIAAAFDLARSPSTDPMATPDAGAVETSRNTSDLIATWRGTWAHTRARVQWAWHQEHSEQRGAHDDLPQINTAFIPSASFIPDDFALAVGCDDGAASDPYPQIVDCPLATGYYARGGAGRLTSITADRPSVTASIAHVRGEHRVEAGVTGEDARIDIAQHFTGGYLRRSLFGSDEIDTRFVELGSGPGFTEQCADDGSAPCRFLDYGVARYRTRSGAAWLLDTWRPGAGIAVEIGARGELTQLGDTAEFHGLLPRVSAAWDPLGGGRSRIFVGWGRVMPQLPGRLAERVGGQPAELTTVTIPQGTSHFLAVDRGLRAADGLAPMIADDVAAGAEVALARALRLSLTAHARILRRNLDLDGVLLTNAGAAGGVGAERQAGELAVELATSPSAPVALHIGYLYARARGNWSGPADPSLGATYYTSGEFTGTPTTGDLASDLRHRFFAEVVTARQISWGQLRVSGRATAASGQALGVFDGGGAVIIARGPLGRTPPVTSVNVRVALRRKQLEFGLEVANLFDRRTLATVDERYTTARVRPIVGGGADDLVFARDDDGAAAPGNPGYGRATRYTPALSGLVYVRLGL